MDKLVQQVRNIVQHSRSRNNALQKICDVLREEVSEFDWVGFYTISENEKNMLELGPYSGDPTEHIKIRFGDGVCGQTALTNKTFIIQNVKEEANYLSCSPHVKAEIVVPIFKDNCFIAELDIDSHTQNSISADYKLLCEDIAHIVEELF